MQLKEWLKERDGYGASTRLAMHLGVTPQRVSDFSNFRRPIPIVIASKIAEYTLGEVSVKELCPDVDWHSIQRGVALSSRSWS